MAKRPTKQDDAISNDLTPDQVDAVERYAATAIMAKMIQEPLSRDKNELIESVLPGYLEEWIKKGTLPSNPRLNTPRAKCQLVVKNVYRIQCSKDQSPTEALKAVGLHPLRAAKFAQLVEEQQQDELIGSFADMANSPIPQIREIADNLLDAIKAHPEWSKLLSPCRSYSLKSPSDINKDLAKMAKSPEELRAVLRVISPQIFPQQATHVDAAKAFQERMDSERPIRKEFVTASGKQKVIAIENKVILYRNKNGEWQHVVTMTTANEKKAQSKAQQLAEDQAELAALLAKYGAI